MTCAPSSVVPDEFKDEECPDCGKTGCVKMISWLQSNPNWLKPHPFQEEFSRIAFVNPGITVNEIAHKVCESLKTH